MDLDPKEIYSEIQKLEQQLERYLRTLGDKFKYTIVNGKVQFEQAIIKAHRQYKISLLRYIFRGQLLSVVTAPVIYAMIIPLAFLDLTLTIYQQICFRAYGIGRVSRKRYIVLDRHQLAYLNGIQKLNCVYCGYGNGLIAYAREILARTEQYWCPIKHAKRVAGSHPRYYKFSHYGDAENYTTRLRELRDELQQEHQEQHQKAKPAKK